MIFIISFLALINTLSYAFMWIDKHNAITKRRRVPESRLFSLALLGGAAGIYMGMKKPLYHKAAKLKFKVIIPLLLLLQTVVAVYFSLR